jgi:hypothetical protein
MELQPRSILAYGVDAPAHRVFRRVRGDCYDHAVMERFFSTVKRELADRFDSFRCQTFAIRPNCAMVTTLVVGDLQRSDDA